MKEKLRPIFLLLAGAGFLTSCLNDDAIDATEQFKKEQAAIDEYIADNDITVEIDSVTDIRYIIESPGTGLSPQDSLIVTVSYDGRILSTGQLVEEHDSVYVLLGAWLPAWRVLLPRLSEGGKITMFIPSYYGYGNVDYQKVPANSTLIHELELHRVETQLQFEQRQIDEYLEEKNLTAEIDTSKSLRYIIKTQGTGDFPSPSSRVKVDYSGKFLVNGKEFDSGKGATFNLNGLIKGWSVLMPYVREGGTITMFLPSQYAYGKRGSGSIPGNTTLMFEVKLIEIVE